MVIIKGFCPSILGSEFTEGFGPSVSVTVVWWSEEDARLSGAFRSFSLAVKSSIEGYLLHRCRGGCRRGRMSIIPAVGILCCVSSPVVKRVKVGCKRAELKYPTVHHFQGNALTGWARSFGTPCLLIGIQQSFATSVTSALRGNDIGYCG
ncbi:hypothetical protein V8G54_009146 [Vigna mungo]|uniref:Uncharacterized protein n=1 Tax=Vigna mungo TaxID=3915 RepID=A0AAQ3S1T8_VIGMU